MQKSGKFYLKGIRTNSLIHTLAKDFGDILFGITEDVLKRCSGLQWVPGKYSRSDCSDTRFGECSDGIWQIDVVRNKSDMFISAL